MQAVRVMDVCFECSTLHVDLTASHRAVAAAALFHLLCVLASQAGLGHQSCEPSLVLKE